MKVALVYDRVNKWGGAERVLLALHELFPNAPLFTSVYHPQKAGWAKVFNVKTSFLQHFPLASSKHELFPLLMPAAFESFSFDDYDLIVSVTSESAKGIITKPKTKHISYCLTPTRYLWSGHEEYFHNKFFKTIATPAIRSLRAWDKIAAHRPDKFVAISKEVQSRIKKYYGKESVVIYPPLTLNSKFEIRNTKQVQNTKSKKEQGEYFLVVSRFVPYKRIDLAIQACNELKLPLKIIGSGAEEDKLKSLAGPTIEFVGKVTDKELSDYYRDCKALLFPGVEDFGLAVVEAQHFGRPVIAFRGGGALETILAGKTGLFFDAQTKESLMSALRDFDKFTFDKNALIQQAGKFSAGKFKEDFLSVVNKMF